MDMDRLPYRSLYSATLLLGATPIFDCNSVYAVPAGQRAPGTVRCPGTLGFSITPHLTSCFYKDALTAICQY
jgi:hypothetical protein